MLAGVVGSVVGASVGSLLVVHQRSLLGRKLRSSRDPTAAPPDLVVVKGERPIRAAPAELAHNAEQLLQAVPLSPIQPAFSFHIQLNQDNSASIPSQPALEWPIRERTPPPPPSTTSAPVLRVFFKRLLCQTACTIIVWVRNCIVWLHLFFFGLTLVQEVAKSKCCSLHSRTRTAKHRRAHNLKEMLAVAKCMFAHHQQGR